MSKEITHKGPGFEKRLTAWLARVAISRRPVVFAVFAVLLVASIALSGNLGVVVDPEEMMRQDNPTVRRFFEVSDTFGFTSTLIVAVEGTDRTAMRHAAHRVVELVDEDPELAALFSAVNLRTDPDYVMTWGKMTAAEIDDIADTQRLLEQRSALGLLTTLNNTLEDVVLADDQQFTTNQDQWRGLAALAGFERLITEISDALATPGGTDLTPAEAEQRAQAILESIFAGELYTWSPNEEMLTFSFLPAYPMEDLEALSASVAGVETIVQQVEQEYPELTLRIGGEIPWVVARHQGATSDTMVPTLLALALILVLFFFSFTRMRSMVLAIFALVVGIILTVGAIVLTVGHISLITSIFAVILLGLGIDFAIHLVSNYDDFRLKGMDTRESLRHAMEAGGAPIILGGVTTACAFLSLGLAGAPAVQEFGIIAGLGVLITLATMMILFPALLVTFGGKAELRTGRRRLLINYSFMGRLGAAIERHPVAALAFTAVITVVAFSALPRNVVDYDPMNNSPRNHRYTETQQRIIDVMEVSPFISFSLGEDLDETRTRAEEFRREPLVSRVLSAADLLPPGDEVQRRLEVIAAGGPAGPRGVRDLGAGGTLEDLLDEIQRLEWNVIELGDLAVAGMGEENLVVRRRDAMVREILGAETGEPGREVFQTAIAAIASDTAAAEARLASLDAALAGALERQQARMAVDRAPTIADLPQDLRRQLVSPDGSQFLITIIPTAETQDGSEVILQYHRDLTQIDPGLTGSVPLYVEMVNEIFEGAARAGIYVIVVVLVLLFAIFRHVRHVLLAFSMVVLGLLWMFGFLPLSGTALTLTAGLVFPLLIGIGTDDALHILHRYRHEGNRIEPALRYSGKAVLLTTLTTMLAFGSLAVAGEMATIASIGALLFIGLGTCFLATVVALPAFLSIGKKITNRAAARTGEAA